MDIVITLLQIVQAFWRIIGFVEQKYQHLLIFWQEILMGYPIKTGVTQYCQDDHFDVFTDLQQRNCLMSIVQTGNFKQSDKAHLLTSNILTYSTDVKGHTKLIQFLMLLLLQR